MDQVPKQERSRKRIEVILTTAENILLDEGIDSVTIANISEVSGLKRTSTYKFFQTPESIKAALATRYLLELKKEFSEGTSNINSSELSVIVLRSVEIMHSYFSSSAAAQSLIYPIQHLFLLQKNLLMSSRHVYKNLLKKILHFRKYLIKMESLESLLR